MTYKLRDLSRDTNPRLYQEHTGEWLGFGIHTTDGTSSREWLQGRNLREGVISSINYLINRDGSCEQLVPKGNIAYHMGQCVPGGPPASNGDWNYYLIGIELENNDRAGQVPTAAQHEALAGLLLLLAQEESISPFHAWGHYGFAWPKGRRTDPAGLDWGFVFWAMAFTPDAVKVQRV